MRARAARARARCWSSRRAPRDLHRSARNWHLVVRAAAPDRAYSRQGRPGDDDAVAYLQQARRPQRRPAARARCRRHGRGGRDSSSCVRVRGSASPPRRSALLKPSRPGQAPRSCLSGSLCYNPPREDYRRQARLEHGRRRSPAAAPEAPRGGRRRSSVHGGRRVVCVSSGAIACPAVASASPSGRGRVPALAGRLRGGQGRLFAHYERLFADHELTAIECSRERRLLAPHELRQRAQRAPSPCFHESVVPRGTGHDRHRRIHGETTTYCPRRRWRSCSARPLSCFTDTRTGCETPPQSYAPTGGARRPPARARSCVGGASQRGAVAGGAAALMAARR